MADTGEIGGVESIDYENSTSSELSTAEDSIPVGTHGSTASKYVRIDLDDDGAPTSTGTSPKHQREDQHNDTEIRERVVSFDSSAESTPRKSLKKTKSSISTPHIASVGQDLPPVDMTASWDGSSPSSGSTKGETTGGKTGYEILFKYRAGLLADPAKIAKEREKEERVRQARERLQEERQKKLEELREQQKMAQENREKQLEMRRKKIDDLRKRDIERRMAVEERRKMKEDIERARRESILQKAEERVARYEAWKAGGRKGGRGHVLGFGSATPRDICQPLERPRRSSSHSALQRRSPNGSDMDSVRPQRRALSACSAVRRHVDSNKIGAFGEGDSPTKYLSVSTSVLYSKRSQEYLSMSTLHPPARQSTSVGTTTAASTHYYPRPTTASTGGTPLSQASMTASLPSPVIRESKSPRKPRPSSIASSAPSFVDKDLTKSQRSKSTDRAGRDRSRTRLSKTEEKTARKKEDEKAQKQEQMDESGKKIKEKNTMKEHGEKKEKKERVSLSFLSRLSTPKPGQKDQEAVSKKDSPVIRIESADESDQDGVVELEQPSPRKAYSTSNLAVLKKKSSLREKQSPTHPKEATPKVVPAKDTPAVSKAAAARSVSPARKDADKPSVRLASPSRKTGATVPLITPPHSAASTPTVPTPSQAVSATSASTTPSQPPATSIADDGSTSSRAVGVPTQDISAEEYKARLAEKRRQAREKAEKDAEDERKRQEEARLAEEERQRKEEEEEKKWEEEALRLAEEAQIVEEERLKKAIEAEEKRKKEEAEKLEQERRNTEEADRKAKAEAEQLEREKQERSKREDEERLERKKKLEMIMKRVKVDTESQPKIESPTKPISSFPSVTHLSSSQSSPDEEQEKSVMSSEASDEESQGQAVAEGSAVQVYSADMTMSFMQDLEEGEMTASTTSSSSTVARSMSSGNIQDRPSSHSERLEERLSHSAGTTPLKSEETAVSYEQAQRLDETRLLQEAIQAEERRREDDAKKLEQERQSRAEIERLAGTEVQQKAPEKPERARKEDEERLERKKKLEMIMKRVKADTESQPKIESSTKPISSFPSVTHLSSSLSSPDEEQEKSVVSSEASDEESLGQPVAEGSAVQVYGADMTMSFMQDLEEGDMTTSTTSSSSTVTRSMSSGNIVKEPSLGREGNEERQSVSAGSTPSGPEERTISSEPTSETKSEFRSPLLQQLVENKGSDSGSPKFKSPLLQNLLGRTKVGSRLGLSASMGDLSPSREAPSSSSQPGGLANSHMTLSASSEDNRSSSKVLQLRHGGEQLVNDHPEFDQVPKSFDYYKFSNGIGKELEEAHFPTSSSSKSSFDSPASEGNRLLTPMRDSALGSSIEPHGDGLMLQSNIFNGHGSDRQHGMDDSSISLYSVEEGVPKSASLTPFETLVESERHEETHVTHDDGLFDDLIGFGSTPVRTFEETNRASDITDLLS